MTGHILKLKHLLLKKKKEKVIPVVDITLKDILVLKEELELVTKLRSTGRGAHARPALILRFSKRFYIL